MATEPAPTPACKRAILQRSDYLQQLPSEILLEVFLQSPDFDSLQALIHTSRKLSLIFEASAQRIVDGTLDRCRVPTETKSLMRAIVSIRTGAFRYTLDTTPQSWEAARQVPLERYQGPAGDHWQDSSPPPTPALLRRFVALVHRVHVLAHELGDGCLGRCAQQLVPVDLAPDLPMAAARAAAEATAAAVAEHVACESGGEGGGGGEGGETTGARAWDHGELGAAPPPPPPPPARGALEPLSWDEEQRLVLWTWMLLYFYELSAAYREGRLELPDCPEAFGVKTDYVGSFWSGPRVQLALTALHLLERRGQPSAVQADQDPSLQEDGGRRCKRFRLPPIADAQSQFRLECQHQAVEDPGWSGLRRILLGYRMSVRFYASKGQVTTTQRSVGRREVIDWRFLKGIGPKPYQLSGIFLWDEERLVELGLQQAGYRTWLQLASADELASARKKVEEAISEVS